MSREELSQSDLIELINGELGLYSATAGCLVASVRRVPPRSTGDCNWVPDRVDVSSDAGLGYLSVFARVIYEFQQRYVLVAADSNL